VRTRARRRHPDHRHRFVTDTLVTTDRTRTLADALGAHYEELDLHGGHMWMLADGPRFAAAVSG